MNPAEAIAEVKARKKQKRRKETVKYIWSIDAVEAVIEEWENRPLLFDCSHPQYHLKEKRRMAIRCKLSGLGIDPLPTVNEITKR